MQEGYTIKEAAEILGVSEQSIYQKIKRKKYRAFLNEYTFKKDGKTFIAADGLDILKNGPAEPQEIDLIKENEDLKKALLKAQQETIEAQRKAAQYADIIIQLQRQRALEIELKATEGNKTVTPEQPRKVGLFERLFKRKKAD